MSTITRDRLLKIQQWRETYGPGSNVVLPAEEAEQLARIALASLEAEAEGVVRALVTIKGGFIRYETYFVSDLPDGDYELYTAPPAPVVSDERVTFNAWNNDTDCPLAGLTVKQAAWLAWLKRSGVIKSFEPATDEFEVWAKTEGLIHDSYGLRTVNTSADVARKAWNACRAAMLQGAEPVTAAYKLPANTPCKEAPEHIWLQTAGVWPENGEFSELTWCSDNQHQDDTLYVRADVVSGNSPVIPDGWVMVPVALTAENGAKACLLGEFSETKSINCPECFGDDECETCDGSGRIVIKVPVSWTNIKAIWARGVEHFAAAPQQEAQ